MDKNTLYIIIMISVLQRDVNDDDVVGQELAICHLERKIEIVWELIIIFVDLLVT